MSKPEVISYGEIALDSPYPIQTLQNIQLTQAVNEHAKLYLTATIQAEQKDRCMQEAATTDVVELYQTSEGKRVRTFFKGHVTALAIRMVRGVYQLELEAMSATAQLDYKPISRSFQNQQLTYEQLLRTVLQKYRGADVIDEASKGAKIEQFILQYRETDWAFLQRMASHFRTVLVPAVQMEQPKLWFGLPEGKRVQLATSDYTLYKNRTLYLRAAQNDRTYPLTEEATCCYSITSTQPANLGDRVPFQGRELVIVKAQAEMRQGIWTYDYELMPETGIRQAKRTLAAHVGLALEGKVLAVQKDQVRLHLSIDASQKQEEAIWFPLATPYSAEGHSGFYSPPEQGDTVQLVLPTAEEHAAYVQTSKRQGGATNPKVADPKTTYWGNSKGKELKLDPQAITVTAKEGAVFLKADEAGGITVQSQHPLTITAGGDLSIVGKNASFQAKESVRFTCSSSSFVLDGNTDIQGQVVSLEGSVKAPVSLIVDSSEEPDVEAALDVLGALPQGGDV